MKNFSFIIVIMVVGIIFPNLLTGAPGAEVRDKDNYGEIVGKIVDGENGKPVTEVFIVYFFKCTNGPSRNFISAILTDENGYFESELMADNYCVTFHPKSIKSKYAADPPPTSPLTKMQRISITKGQVTELLKKVKTGGKLLIRILTPIGTPVDPDNYFTDEASMTISINGSNIDVVRSVQVLSKKNDSSLNHGEYALYKIYPGKVDIDVSFGYVGYVNVKRDEVEIVRNKTTVVDIQVNKDDKTGVEGRVIDKKGETLDNWWISASGIVTATATSDATGYYKIFGLKAGTYELSITRIAGSIVYNDTIGNITVLENAMTIKNIFVEWENN